MGFAHRSGGQAPPRVAARRVECADGDGWCGTMAARTARQLAEAVEGTLQGDPDLVIRGVARPEEAGPNDLVLLAADRYLAEVEASDAGLVLTTTAYDLPGRNTLVVENPDLASVTVLGLFADPIDVPAIGIHPTATIADDAELGEAMAVGPNVVIGRRTAIGPRTVLHAGVVIGSDVRVGSECVLWPNVVVRERCTIGNRVIVHPNTTIGADGFGYEFIEGRHVKVPQIGTVAIEDDVEIGANCAVDRAKWGRTVIGRGSKIDNLVQIAHNVRIGEDCIVVAQVGIGGSVDLGKYVVIGGRAGVRDHVRIGDGVRAAAACGITKDILAGAVVNGIPAVDNSQYLREQAAARKLPALLRQMRELTRRMENLESANDH